jgi:uncharacterized membrane protein
MQRKRRTDLTCSLPHRLARAFSFAPVSLPRWRALDALRCLAIVLMVQGHTFYALLDPGVRVHPWFWLHDRLHGLTAPMFLFASGLAFGVTTLGSFAEHARLGPALRQRMTRYAMLIAIGYALQLPGQSLIAPLHDGTLLTAPVLRIGPLQALGVVLGVCQLLVLATQRRGLFIACTTGLLAITLCVSPWLWQSGLSDRMPLPLAMWLDSRRGSDFPLFPWAVFVFAGVIVAELVRECSLAAITWRLSCGGAVLAAVSPWLWYGGYGPDAWAAWATSPFFVLERLGYVLLALAGLCALELALGTKIQFSFELTAQLSRRSLVVYVVHLLILYGTPFTPNVAYRISTTLGFAPALAVSAAVLLATTLIARGWDELASPERAEARRRVQLSLAGVALYCLVARDAFWMIQIGLANP